MILAALVYQRLHPQLRLAVSSPPVPDSGVDDDDALRRGEYAVIRSLVRVVENGKQAKETVDEACLLLCIPFHRCLLSLCPSLHRNRLSIAARTCRILGRQF